MSSHTDVCSPGARRTRHRRPPPSDRPDVGRSSIASGAPVVRSYSPPPHLPNPLTRTWASPSWSRQCVVVTCSATAGDASGVVPPAASLGTSGRAACGVTRDLRSCRLRRHSGSLVVPPAASLDAVLEGVADQLLAAVEVKLPQDVADVVLDRLLRDEELLTDLAVAVAPGHVLQHLALALGQRLRRARRLGDAAELAEHQRCQRGGEHGLAPGRPPQLAAQLLRRRALDQVAVGAGGDGVEQVALLLADRQHDDVGVLAAGAGHLEAPAVGHVQVAHHQVGVQRSDELDRLVGVARLAHDVKVRSEVGPKAGAPDRVVVRHHDTHRREVPAAAVGVTHGAAAYARRISFAALVAGATGTRRRREVPPLGDHASMGTQQRSSVPRPGRPSTSTRPPTSTIRPRTDRLRPAPSAVAPGSNPVPSSLTEQKSSPSSGSAYTVTVPAPPCLPALASASPTAPASASTTAGATTGVSGARTTRAVPR